MHFVTPPLEALGSSYIELELGPSNRGKTFQVWLKGEYGVRWSLAVSRRDSSQQEISRIFGPERKDLPVYLVIETTPDTHSLLLAVTNLSWRNPQAAYPDSSTRSFDLTLAIKD